jgi:3-hexulose-6-phosphate synthase
VTGLKSAHPDKVILADLKTSDVGAYEANMACKAGADIVTTQGITTTATILEVHRESARWKKRAEVDLTGVTDPVGRARELQALGIDLVVFHRSIDQELTEGALWDEQARRSVLDLCALGLDVAVAGGLSASVMPLLSGVPIFAIVVGRGITAQREPAQAAREIEERVRQFWPG